MPRALSEALIDGLARAGVDAMFGVPGGGANLDKVGAAQARGMRFVLMHGETAACIAASTYGLLTGQAGLAIATRGPGVASAVNGAAAATLDRSPLVLVSDTVPAAQAGRVPHQRLDQVALLRPVTKWSGTLGTADPAALARGAAELATAAPAGAVHLDFDPTTHGDAPPPRPSERGSGAQAWARAEALVAASQRPLVLAGLEAVGAAEELRALASRVGCPVLPTYQAKGVVADTSPSTGPLFTNGAAERTLVEQADLILAVGLDPVEPIAAPWPYAAPVVVAHPRELTDAYFPLDVQLVGRLSETLRRLEPSLHSTWGPDAAGRARRGVVEAIAAAARGFGPQELVGAVQEELGEAVQVTVDAGAHFLVAMPLWSAAQPRDVLISNGLATMGFALPAAIGAALARPRRRVVCFVGDGGLGMTLAELETLARLRLEVVVVVFNDAALTLIEIKQRGDHGGAEAVRYRPTDFAATARAAGVAGVVAEDAETVRAALSSWRSGPLLIDARIDPSAYRRVISLTRG